MAAKKNELGNRVTVRINRIPGQKVQEDVVISINGERYQIQRGVDVSVPRFVAAALERWNKEQDEAERTEIELMDG